MIGFTQAGEPCRGISMTSSNKSEGIPQWLGNIPFPPERKTPCILSRENAKTIFYGSGREKICVTIYCSTDRVLLSEWEVPPGQSFQPADIHSGDETYYILEGVLTETDHTTGQVVEVKQGEVIHIPARTWHNAYNFTDKKLHLLNPAEGGMWAGNDLEQVSDFKQNTTRYKGHQNESVHDIIGSAWPQNVHEKQAKYKMRCIPPGESLTLIHGTENETKFRFFVSNERLHVGTFVVCPGKLSDPEVHGGDEALCVLQGSLQISLTQEHERKDVVMRDAIQVMEGQKYFIPEGVRHQYFNLTSEMCEVLFIVSPTL